MKIFSGKARLCYRVTGQTPNFNLKFHDSPLFAGLFHGLCAWHGPISPRHGSRNLTQRRPNLGLASAEAQRRRGFSPQRHGGMEPQKGHDNLTAKIAKTNHSVMGRRGDALRLVRADTAALPSFLRELGGNSAGGKRARAERFGDAPFRELKPHGYRRSVAPRLEKPGTSRPRPVNF